MQMSERKLSMPQQIEQRAYELYLERGGEHGHDRADWLTAENELIELPEQSNSGATKAWTAAAALQATSPKGARVAQKVPVEIVER
jgi:Protein of unknown function (DUF2934)